MKTTVALFDTFSDAQGVVRELESAGFSPDHISMIAQSNAPRAEDGSATATGAAIGAGLGLLAGLAAVTVPGVGIVLAVGPIIASGILGAVAGGLIGSLVDSGVPQDQAAYYAEGIRRGGTLVVVAANDDQVAQVVQTMNRHNAIDLDQRVADWRAAGWTPPATAAVDDTRPAAVQRAVATETPDPTGQTTMGDEIAAIPVPNLTATTPAPSAQPTHDAHSPREARAYADFERLEPDFRDNFQQSFPGSQYVYEQYKPAYQYGCQLARDDDARDWEAIEPRARSSWEGGHPGTWDRMKSAARYAFDRTKSHGKSSASS